MICTPLVFTAMAQSAEKEKGASPFEAANVWSACILPTFAYAPMAHGLQLVHGICLCGVAGMGTAMSSVRDINALLKGAVVAVTI